MKHQFAGNFAVLFRNIGRMRREQHIGGRPERRQVSRYALPALEIVIAGERFRAINWSLSGALLHGICHDIGVRVRGEMGVAGSIETLPFAATILRADLEVGTTAICFEDHRTDRIEFLDSAGPEPLQ